MSDTTKHKLKYLIRYNIVERFTQSNQETINNLQRSLAEHAHERVLETRYFRTRSVVALSMLRYKFLQS